MDVRHNLQFVNILCVTMAEEANKDVEVVASGGRNPVLLPDRTLTRSELFLATIRRARCLLSAIKLNRAR